MRLSLLISATALLLACESDSGDPPSARGLPPPEGREKRIRDIADPTLPDHPAHQESVVTSGAVVIAVDTYDETGNGRSRGTIYVQDLSPSASPDAELRKAKPYSGISLFAPAFIPGNLRVAPGDVLDFRGEYQENTNIGTVAFAPGAVLPQLARPIGTFRFEAQVPEPREIDINDLMNFETGRQWIGMLVKVRNVTAQDELRYEINRDDGTRPKVAARHSSRLLPSPDPNNDFPKCEMPFPKAPTLVNEFAEIRELDVDEGTTFTSITGVVTFFCNLHIAPRTLADIER